MQETIEAIYKDGVLRPLKPLAWLEEDRQVTITVTSNGPAHPLEDVIGILPDEDAHQMRQIIEAEFRQVDEDEWK
jgi:predicted DNA-binding antitoxin AbrB/MazE fold protein